MNDKRVIESLRNLHDLSKAINSSLRIGDVVDMICNKTLLLMNADRVLLLILDEMKTTLTVFKTLGIPDSDLPVEKFYNIRSFDHCIVHKGTVITMDEVVAPEDQQNLRQSMPFLFNMFFAPLEIQGRAYGLLGVNGKQREFSPVELEIFCSLGSQAAVAMENANLYQKLHLTFLHTAEALAEAINSRDPYTGGHTRRVQDYALQMADALGLEDEDKESLRLAAILHDIGKIGIDDAILKKTGPLTAEEEKEIQEHPRIGSRILGYVDEMKDVVPGVLHHHEMFDGSGYPDGLAGEQIPLQARIIAIADNFDALTTDRPYRRASTTQEALTMLSREGGSHFDPEIIPIFRALHLKSGQDKFPVNGRCVDKRFLNKCDDVRK